MSPHFSPDVLTRFPPDNLDSQVLSEAQDCLRSREKHQMPSEGESHAWEWFYHTYDPMLRVYVMSCHLSREEATDCLQEIWKEVVKKLAAFHSDGSQCRLCSWLCTIAHSKATDSVPRAARLQTP
jgi:DNA-directed RNA polymerase specialized sigma24 family protein